MFKELGMSCPPTGICVLTLFVVIFQLNSANTKRVHNVCKIEIDRKTLEVMPISPFWIVLVSLSLISFKWNWPCPVHQRLLVFDLCRYDFVIKQYTRETSQQRLQTEDYWKGFCVTVVFIIFLISDIDQYSNVLARYLPPSFLAAFGLFGCHFAILVGHIWSTSNAFTDWNSVKSIIISYDYY